MSYLSNTERVNKVSPYWWNSARVFRQFAWLQVGSGKMALSRPAHQRVPITAVVKCEDKTLAIHVNRVQTKICRASLCSSGRFFVT